MKTKSNCTLEKISENDCSKMIGPDKCTPNTSCSVSSGTHISIDCVRTATTNAYGSTTPAANSNTIKCSVSGGNVTVSFGFKKTNGQSSGGAVNSGSSSTFSGISAITSVSISQHSSDTFEAYSPTLISNYNEYNAEVDVINSNNEYCYYQAYENNKCKFKGPKYDCGTVTPTPTPGGNTCNGSDKGWVTWDCNANGCTYTAHPSCNYPDIGTASYGYFSAACGIVGQGISNSFSGGPTLGLGAAGACQNRRRANCTFQQDCNLCGYSGCSLYYYSCSLTYQGKTVATGTLSGAPYQGAYPNCHAEYYPEGK